MRNGQYYRVNQKGDRYVYIPLRNSLDLNGSGATGAENSSPVTPPSNSRRGKNPPIPPSPPLVDDMDMHMKLPTFKGVGDEDMDRFWFVENAVWTMQNVNTDVVKRAQMVMAFEGNDLDWFMGYLNQHVDPTIQHIKDALKQQFRKPKSYSQCIVDLKDFKQVPIESVWEADQ